MMEEITWNNSVKMMSAPIILKQLGLAIGLPFGVLAFVLILASGADHDALYGLFLVGALLLLTALLTAVLYRGRYDARFKLDSKGAYAGLAPAVSKRASRTAALTVTAGALAGQPSAAGAGVLAASNRAQYLEWGEVHRIDEQPKRSTLILRGPLASHVALFCTPENYEQVRGYVTLHVRAIQK